MCITCTFIYHSYLTGINIRLLIMKLHGALNSCTIHHTGFTPSPHATTGGDHDPNLKGASHFAISDSCCKELCFPDSRNLKTRKTKAKVFSALSSHDPSLGTWGQFSDTRQDPVFRRIRGQRSTVSQTSIYEGPTSLDPTVQISLAINGPD
jgi:hypothetical protein